MTVKQSYFVAETVMPSNKGFDFNGASRSFNVLAEYLFGKVRRKYMNFSFTPNAILIRVLS